MPLPSMQMARVSRFLNRLEKRIAPHVGVRNIVIPEIRSAEVFASLERQFQSDVLQYLEPAAIDYIDERAVNEYWFIIMLASALVLAESVPLTAADAQAGVLLLRRRFGRDNTSAAIFEKVQSGAFEKLAPGEMGFAKHEGLIVWDASSPYGDMLRINPAMFL